MNHLPPGCPASALVWETWFGAGVVLGGLTVGLLLLIALYPKVIHKCPDH